jgi:predicted Zn finger-like uncharacterized protein
MTIMRCPQCSTPCRVSEQAVARKVRCTKCDHIFTVPAAKPDGPLVQVEAVNEQTTTKPTPASARPVPAVRDNRDDPDERPAARSSRAPRRKASGGSALLPLLLGGGGLLVVLGFLVVSAGVGAWLLFRSSSPSPKTTESATVAPLAEANPARSIDELKAATVYVKVSAGGARGSGSGFVVKVDGNTAYIVTNEHVVYPRPNPAPGMREPWAGPPPEVTAVFHSGTKDEQSFRADIVAADLERDLAVLKIAGAGSLPRPIDAASPPNLIETLPVTVFGFPFGDALAVGAGNPSITVSKGTVSSIRRNKADEVVAVQIDGALNPGNSGGPVVDAEGRLVGVAVATIRGAHIGLAVPGHELLRMFEGRVGAVRVATKGLANSVEVEVPVIDPLNRVRSVVVGYLRADLVQKQPRPQKGGGWSELSGALRLAMRREGQRAVVVLRIPDSDQGLAFTFQASYVTAGREVYDQPYTLAPRQQVPVVVRPPIGPPIRRPPIIPPKGKRRPRLDRGPLEDLPGGRLPPIKRPVLVAYKPYVPTAQKQDVPLPGPATEVVVGGAGQYLVLRLPAQRKLAVFDVQQGKVAHYVPLAEDGAHLAAGATQLVVVYPRSKLMQTWGLASGKRERSVLLPGALTADTIHQICMGSASAGPLFVHLRPAKRTVAVDLGSLDIAEVRWMNWAPNNAIGPHHMRASPDGTRLIGWDGGWSGCDVAELRDGAYATLKPTIDFWGTEGAFALPSADGRFIFTPRGRLNRRLKQVPTPELKGAYVVPAAEPGPYLALAGTCNLGAQPPYKQVAGEMSVHTEDRKLLFVLRGLDELKAVVKMPWEQRIHYYPHGKLLVTLGAEADRLILRRIDLTEQLDRSDIDYLVVVSRPPAARAGAAFSYRLDVRSKQGGVKVRLESGPAGLTVTAEGQVSWNVPAKLESTDTDVVVTVTDRSGQEVFHTFSIELLE